MSFAKRFEELEIRQAGRDLAVEGYSIAVPEAATSRDSAEALSKRLAALTYPLA